MEETKARDKGSKPSDKESKPADKGSRWLARDHPHGHDEAPPRPIPLDERGAIARDMADNALAQAFADHLTDPRLERMLAAIRAGRSPESEARAFIAYNRPAAVRTIAVLLDLAANPPAAAFYNGPASPEAWRALARDGLLNAGGAGSWEPSGPGRQKDGPSEAEAAAAVVRFGLGLCVACGDERAARYYPSRTEGAWYCLAKREDGTFRCQVDDASYKRLSGGMGRAIGPQGRALGLT